MTFRVENWNPFLQKLEPPHFERKMESYHTRNISTHVVQSKSTSFVQSSKSRLGRHQFLAPGSILQIYNACRSLAESYDLTIFQRIGPSLSCKKLKRPLIEQKRGVI